MSRNPDDLTVEPSGGPRAGSVPAGREALAATLIAAATGVLFVFPIFSGWDRWGIGDWDQHQTFYGFARWSIVERGEWPFWNPFVCGGNPFLADPQSPFLYPLFAVVLFLGVIPGLKILIAVHASLSIFGAWLFGRRLGCGVIAAWIPAAAYGLSSAYALHIAAGHSTWFAMAWVPAALAALHAGFDRPRLGLLAGAAAAMIAFIGNAYLFTFLLLFSSLWVLLATADRRSIKPPVACALMILSALGLAAIKLLPMNDFLLKTTTLDTGDRPSASLSLIAVALLGRRQALRAYADELAGQPWHFWEYGAYIGPIVATLALAAVVFRFRRAWPLAAVAAAALAISLGHAWGPWDLVRTLPMLAGLRVPSRAIIFSALFLGTLAGLLVTQWERPGRRVLLALGVVLIAADIGWVGRAALPEAFVLAPVDPPRGEFRQAIGKKRFQGAWDPAVGRYLDAYSDMYPGLLANRGTINCYDRLHIPVHAQPETLAGGLPNPAYRGEAYLTSGGVARLVEIGGRAIEIDVAAAAPGVLVVNQNYDSGWRARDSRPVKERGGLLAVEVEPGERRIALLYTPPRFWFGAALTLASLAAILAGGLSKQGGE